MALKIRNSLVMKVEEFIPLEKGKVKMYTCGPTVYSTPHIGNFRTFFMADLLRRYLEFKGYEVFQIMNLTDIDDKTIRDSGKNNMNLQEFTEKYSKIFFDGLDWLNIKRAHIYPRATEHINEMIDFIKKLQEKGYAYETDDGVYFSIKKFKNYGKLINLELDQLKVGDRAKADSYDKDNVQDFALWKKSTPEEMKRKIYYESPWGKGRPGWHIECSAMSMKYFGESFDVHTGAIDLKFPHHSNEIAQSEALTGKPFVKYWIHGEFLNMAEEKMSKSLGNIKTLADVKEKFTPDTIRYFFLSTRYDAMIIFSEDKLISAKNSVERLQTTYEKTLQQLRTLSTISKWSTRENELITSARKIKTDFEKGMADNLDTTLGLKAIHELSKNLNKYLEGEINHGVLAEVFEIYKLLLKTFGLFEKLPATTEQSVPDIAPSLMNLILELREDARKAKNYSISDKIRDKLNELNISLEDSSKGPIWKLKK